MAHVRPPAVAGTFYPPYRDELLVAAWVLSRRGAEGLGSPRHHYTSMQASSIQGPSPLLHGTRPAASTSSACSSLVPRIAFASVASATSSADVFATPLADVRVDRHAVEAADGCPASFARNSVHAGEHSLEVELPFLGSPSATCRLFRSRWETHGQTTLPTCSTVSHPISSTLIAVSSDLSHYLPYEVAKERDLGTTRAIEALAAEAIADDDACGASAVRGLLTLAKRRGWTARTLADVRSSGDTAGIADEVVGYGAWAFS